MTKTVRPFYANLSGESKILFPPFPIGVKSYLRINKRFGILFILLVFGIINNGKILGQAQTIGSFPLLGGGLEEFTAASSLSSTNSTSSWCVPAGGITGSLINNASIARTGSQYISMAAYASSGKYVTSPFKTNTIINNTDYIIQFYYKTSDGTSGAWKATFYDGGNTKRTTSMTLTGTSNSWVKSTTTVNSSTTLTNALLAGGIGTNGSVPATMFDDFVIYAGTVDVTPPSTPSNQTATANNGSVTLNWTGDQYAGDGGGYVIVQSTSATAVTLNTNGIYGVGNTTATGSGTIKVITAGVSGTAQSTTITGLTNGTTYYYTIFAADKAFNYSTGVTCSGTPSAGSPSIAIADNGTSSAGNIFANNTKKSLLPFSLTNSGSAVGTVNSVAFTTTGTATGSDLSNFKLYYSSSASGLSSATQLSSLSAGAAGTYTFTGLTQTIAASGGVGYFWITTDVASSPTIGNTVAVNATPTVTLAATSVSGSTSAGGLQTVISGPVVTVNGWATGSGTFGNQIINTTSGEHSFTVSGTNLDAAIVLVPPAGFDISETSGSGFVNSSSNISLSPSNGTVATTTIYVRYAPTAVGSASANITINSTNTNQQTKVVSGFGIAVEPTTQATNASTSNVLFSSIGLSWSAGNGTKYLVLYSTNSNVGTANLPVDATTYTVGSTTASGYIVGYVGASTSATIIGLSASTQYYFAVFTYNDGGTAGAENYLTSSPSETNATTAIATSATDAFRSVGTGTWANASTWESYTNSTWMAATSAPTSSAASVIIQNGHTVTVDAATEIPSTTVNATGVLKATAAITLGSGKTLTVNGTYEHALDGGTIPISTWSSGSNCLVTGTTATFPANTAQNYYNFTWNCPSQTVTNSIFFLPTQHIYGTVNLITTNSKSTRLASIPTADNTYTIVIDGDFIVGNGATITTNGSTRAGILQFDIAGKLEISGNLNGNNSQSGNIAEFYVDGDFIINSTGVLTKGSSGSTRMFFTKSGLQNYTKSSSTVLPLWDITVNATSVLNLGNQLIDGIATFTTTSSSTLKTSHTGGLNGNLTTTGTKTLNAGTNYIFNGSSAQVTGALLTAANNIEIANSAGVTLSENTTSTALAINSGTILSIPAGKQLTVSTTMTNNGILNLLSSGSGTATIKTPATISGNGTASVQQHLSTSRNWYVSSPVTGASLPGAGFTLYAYDETGSHTADNPVGPYWYSPTGNFTKGLGYIAYPGSSGATLSFNGTLNSGTVDIQLTRLGAAKTGFNLIGNPYPCHLTWTEAFVNDATTAPEGITAPASLIEPSIWIRHNKGSANNGQYADWEFQTLNGISREAVPSTTLLTNGIIPPMQAFWVRAKVGGTLRLNDLLTKSHQSSNPLKVRAVKNTDRKRLRLVVSNGTNTDETLMYFDAAASDAYDRYDSPKFNEANTVTQIYTTAGTEKLVINGMHSLPLNQEIGLGFVPGSATAFSLRATELTNIPADVRVILKDNVSKAETDLTDGVSVYEFAPATTTDNRFSVIFRTAGATTGFEKSIVPKAYVYVNANNQITINAPEKSNYSIYNAVGQLIENGILTSNTQTSNFKPAVGMYVVKVDNQSIRVIIK